MTVAFNKETGEVLTLGADGRWAKAAMAQNDKGERVFLDGDQWKPLPKPAAPSGPDQTTWGERIWRGAKDVGEGIAQTVNRLPDWMHGSRRGLMVNGRMTFLSPEETSAQRNAERVAYDAHVAQGASDYQARRGEAADDIDWLRIGGNVLATLPAAAVFRGATIPGAVASGAASGALTGAMQPVVENQENFWTEKAKQAGVGAGFGGPVGALGNVLGRFVSPRVSPEIQSLIDKGVYPPPGQIIGGAAKRAEDTVGIGSRSGVAQEYTRAAINDALAPLGIKLPADAGTGQAAIIKARELVSRAYDDVWSANNKVSFDNKASTELNGIIAEAKQRFKNEAQREEFLDLVDAGISGIRGLVTGESVRATIKGLRETAEDYIRNGGPRATMGRYLNRIADSAESSAVRTNPALAEAKAAADRAYAGMARIVNAASRDMAEGLVTPQTLANAVRSEAMSNAAVATGEAMLQPLAAAGLKALPPMVNSAAPYLTGAGIGGAGAAGSFLTGDPKYAATAGALGMLYTPTGRRMFANVMTQRPSYAEAIADALRRGTPFAAGAAGATATPAFVK